MAEPLLTEAQVQSAFDWLLESGAEIAAARAMVLRCEYKVKAVRSRLELNAPDGPMDRKKAWAACQSEYLKACDEHVDAIERWERLSDQRNKVGLIMEAWRTMCANDRGLRKIG